MHTVQLAIEDAVYAAALREALMRSGPWRVVPVSVPDLDQKSVVVLDEDTFNGLPVPPPAPERIVLITRKDPQHLSRAWDAGIVSVVSVDDAPSTVLLAIMAAALRLPKMQPTPLHPGGNSPTPGVRPASIPPQLLHSALKTDKLH